MQKFMLYCICITGIFNIYAAVPTIDVAQELKDIDAMKSYTAKVATIVYNIGQAVDIAEQIRNLKSLQDVERVGGSICKLCSASEQFQLQQYINQVNDDLCSQFSMAIKSVISAQDTVKSIQGIISSFSTNPKEAGLALQAAAAQANTAIQGSLSQIQVLLVQSAQKQLAEEKIAKQNNDAIYTGFKQNGL